jgi:hypothetical protein
MAVKTNTSLNLRRHFDIRLRGLRKTLATTAIYGYDVKLGHSDYE